VNLGLVGSDLSLADVLADITFHFVFLFFCLTFKFLLV